VALWNIKLELQASKLGATPPTQSSSRLENRHNRGSISSLVLPFKNRSINIHHARINSIVNGLFVWLVADGWCWFVLREKYCRLVPDGWFALREKYYWLVADKPSEQGENLVLNQSETVPHNLHRLRMWITWPPLKQALVTRPQAIREKWIPPNV
jgi:hypothetical protein